MPKYFDFSVRYEKHSPQRGEIVDRTPGTAIVDDSGYFYRYRVKRGEIREFRRWLRFIFGCHRNRVSGRYPSYKLK